MDNDEYFTPIILCDLNTPWERALPLGIPRSFPAGSIVPDASVKSPNAGLYYIKRGRIRLSYLGVGGREKGMLYMGKGTLFNEIPMWHYSQDYIFTAMEQTETVFWSKKKFTVEFIREYPELLLNLLQSTGKKTRSFYTQIGSAHGTGAFGSVCRLLFSMHLFNREGDTVVPRLSQLEVAAFLGIHRSSLHKALIRLKDEDIIGAYSRRSLHILNAERLRAYASPDTCSE